MASVSILESVQPTQIKNAFSVFAVDKQDGSGRLIYNCKPWTDKYDPPKVYLPKPTELVNSVTTETYFAKVDLCDGFYQVQLSAYTSQFFGIKCGKKFSRFRRLPMG